MEDYKHEENPICTTRGYPVAAFYSPGISRHIQTELKQPDAQRRHNFYFEGNPQRPVKNNTGYILFMLKWYLNYCG